MNYLIVMPRIVHALNETYLFPLGIAYVSASLKAVRDTVFTLNLNSTDLSVRDALVDSILKNKIDVLAVGGLSPQYNHINEIINTAKEIKGDLKVIVGGGLITASPRVAMSGLDADFGIIGEGEFTIRDLADAIEGKKNVADVKGLIYRRGKELVKNEPREDIQDLDSVPFPDYEGFQYGNIVAALNTNSSVSKDAGVADICTSRSCPYKCTFCFHSCGQKYRTRSLDNVFQEIDMLVSKYPIKMLQIQDELFFADKQRGFEFCERIKPYQLNWSCSLRMDLLTAEVLKAMKDAGCILFGYGFESADNRILKSMNKKITIEQIEQGLKEADKANMLTSAMIIMGDAEETFETFNNSLKWLREHPQYEVNLNTISVLPGSPLYHYAVENGYITDELKYLQENCPQINVSKMSDAEYKKCIQLMSEVMGTRFYLPKNFKLLSIDYENKNACVEIECNKCGSVHSFDVWDFFGEYMAICDCGQSYRFPLYLCIKDLVDEAMEAFLNQATHPIVIYGMSKKACSFLGLCEMAKSDQIKISDSNRFKQGNYLFDKKVLSLDEINETECETLVLGATINSSKNEISNKIRSNCPKIKKIIDLNDFIEEILLSHIAKEK